MPATGTGAQAPVPSGLVDRADRFSRSATGAVAALGVAGMLLVGVATLVDVLILRPFLNSPLPGFNEVLQTAFAVAIASVLASGLATRAAVRVDVLAGWLGPRWMRWIAVAGDATGLALYAFLALACYRRAELTLMIHGQTTVLQLPTGPFMVAIAAFLAICVPVQAIAALVSLRDALRDEGPRWKTPALIVAAALLAAGALAVWGVPALAALRPAPGAVALAGFGALWVLVLLTLPVGTVMTLVGLLGTALLMGWGRTVSNTGSTVTGLLMNGELALIPLFLMMGAFATVAGLSADIYRLAQAALGWLKGGVAMATVAACGGFGALTGSSIATVATIGAVAAPEMKARGYAPSLSAGAIASGATLGQLVPPSTVIVLYAILVEQSIGRLYIAALVPAAMTLLGYLVVIFLAVRFRPALAPGRDHFSLVELGRALLGAMVVVALFGTVIGGIYAGIFTATEAASVGAVVTFGAALVRGRLRGGAIRTVAAETTAAIAMIYPLIIGALLLTFFLDLSGLPALAIGAVEALSFGPLATILLMIVGFVALGTVMDSVAVLIMTAGIAAPIVVSLGYDPIWWGIVMLIVVELGVITPPFGLNLFMLKSVTRDFATRDVYRGVLPFIAADLLKLMLLLAVPAIVLWLPGTMR
ncbi:MAG: TRAP transporter large permease subunit [Rhodobacteraceae bacterium]|nr:TRAP transporter large permease subunit [Paracoccaceae bacterium]